ncbi:MAG: hypothetical protein E7I84_12915, partial [Staphylococcus warneri]|nr:hypothetical protein [Staphylococcus warneri]
VASLTHANIVNVYDVGEDGKVHYIVMELIEGQNLKDIIKNTNRRVTFEYSLIKGVNDSKEDANQLAKILKGMLCHVNLIPINKVEERNYEKPDKTYVYKFRDLLLKENIAATIRREMGADINGACGQLRRKHK